LFTFETARSETPDNISCFGFDDGCVSDKKIRSAVSSVQDAAGELATENADIVDKIVSLGKALHLKVNKEDVEELVEENSKDLTTEDLEELKKQLNQERDKEDKECSSEVDSNKKGRIPTGDIKKMLHYWEELQYLVTKWHPNKAEMNRLCALVEDKCLNYFKNILKNREVQSTFDRFSTSPLAKRQRPATEEEETYLELTLKIWKKNIKNVVYIFSV
jgi:hypothetical protein